MTGVGRPLAWGTAGLALVGLGVSVYLTVAHYTTSTILACPDTGLINCARVTTSAQSVILGVPVAVLGLVYYVVMVALCSPPAWRVAALRRPRLALSGVGVVMVLYLVYTELFVLDAICLWCTSVHVVTVVLFASIALGTAFAQNPQVQTVEPARA